MDRLGGVYSPGLGLDGGLFILSSDDMGSYPKGESHHFGLVDDQQEPNGLREEVPQDNNCVRA